MSFLHILTWSVLEAWFNLKSSLKSIGNSHIYLSTVKNSHQSLIQIWLSASVIVISSPSLATFLVHLHGNVDMVLETVCKLVEKLLPQQQQHHHKTLHHSATGHALEMLSIAFWCGGCGGGCGGGQCDGWLAAHIEYVPLKPNASVTADFNTFANGRADLESGERC